MQLLKDFKIKIHSNPPILHYGFKSTSNVWNKLSRQDYTERQEKLVTSSERRSLKSTASKLIIFRHI